MWKRLLVRCKSFCITWTNKMHYFLLIYAAAASQPNAWLYQLLFSGFGGLGVSMLAFGTQVRGFKPGQSRQIFKGKKILRTPSFAGEVKPLVPCHRFAACKRSQKWNGSHHFWLNYLTPFSHSSWGRGGAWWRKWECLNNSVCVCARAHARVAQ
jgi:hypothetical protein